MKYIKTLVITAIFAPVAFLLLSSQQKSNTVEPKITWYSYEQALEINKNYPKKKIFVDVYTEWCGWCKKMDATTFQNPVIVDYMNKNFIAVKLDAERKDTIVIEGHPWVNQNANKARGTHQIAEYLLNGRMSYPSYVFLDELAHPITVVPGYYEASQFEMILNYFGNNDHLKYSWEQYQKNFKGKILPPEPK